MSILLLFFEKKKKQQEKKSKSWNAGSQKFGMNTHNASLSEGFVSLQPLNLIRVQDKLHICLN